MHSNARETRTTFSEFTFIHYIHIFSFSFSLLLFFHVLLTSSCIKVCALCLARVPTYLYMSSAALISLPISSRLFVSLPPRGTGKRAGMVTALGPPDDVDTLCLRSVGRSRLRVSSSENRGLCRDKVHRLGWRW